MYELLILLFFCETVMLTVNWLYYIEGWRKEKKDDRLEKKTGE